MKNVDGLTLMNNETPYTSAFRKPPPIQRYKKSHLTIPSHKPTSQVFPSPQPTLVSLSRS